MDDVLECSEIHSQSCKVRIFLSYPDFTQRVRFTSYDDLVTLDVRAIGGKQAVL